MDRLTITDERTGKAYPVEILEGGAIRTADLRQIKLNEGDFGLMGLDPGLVNTAICHSEITFVDGENGMLEYRGHRIEDLCENATYLEVAYLLLNGRLPDEAEFAGWEHEVTIHTYVHESVKKFMEGFRYDAHPMGMLLATVAALSTFYPSARQISDPEERYMASVRLIAKVPTLAAFAYRHARGLPYVYPDNDLGYAENLLSMLFKTTEPRYQADPRLIRALDLLFILHADHEQNCSTNAVRAVGSSQVDPYSAISAGIAALFGPAHGGANEAVVRMLERVGSVERIPEFLQGVKDRRERLMGFGHRVYKNFDPRAEIIKSAVEDVLDATGARENPKLRIALEIEKRALEDEYFRSRRLYPNVDFYSGLMYEALGIPTEMSTVI
ncbi:MAG: citrate synthase, partial [Solirubrobacterales bacterium]